MAVYTDLAAHELGAIVDGWDVGRLVSAKGIAEGISNSNWLIETAGSPRSARFVLTMYERRIDLGDLPFFLGLLDHLAAAGLPVPRPIHDPAGAPFRMVGDKAVALIEYRSGISPAWPTPRQAHAAGAVLARIHLAGASYQAARGNVLDPPACAAMLAAMGPARLRAIDPALPPFTIKAAELAERWPQNLPVSVIHADLFPDNVLMVGDSVTGVIDFYFACTDQMAYDLAVTHSAWAFDRRTGAYREDIGRALIEGYGSVRSLLPAERSALALLAQGACLRFVASRVEDWFEQAGSHEILRKDPLDYARRWQFYESQGNAIFA